MIVYSYDPVTRIYTGTTEADPSPLEEDVWLKPANSTDVPPPEAGEHEVAVYAEDEWKLAPDWRGHFYYLSDGSKHMIGTIGVIPHDDALDEPPPQPIEAVKNAALSAIDSAAGAARARYITVIPGQEATYQLKVDEASAYIAAGRPADTAAYLMLVSEASARGINVSQIADIIVATRARWVRLAAMIEAQRVGGKLAVEAAAAAGDRDGIASARDAAVTALEAM